ncbi:MAG TPA: hypothetical protein VF272_03265 [Candidatus Saccharimonadia bacterium]
MIERNLPGLMALLAPAVRLVALAVHSSPAPAPLAQAASIQFYSTSEPSHPQAAER